ncbi:hypothetical protein SCHPADRAFT_535108 [Schizopora paradoxa]|uniref:NACHT domain-containing protein n=1 Tax=Schizopora paradoxa TaxID=27342 RepID=A0A0H2RE60_9AGAM|nr:hypothetical protein SCHPADRAFT_535108 [Schizopora paradoxa]
MLNSFPGRSDRNGCKDIYTIYSRNIISDYQKNIADRNYDIDAGVEYKFIGEQSMLSLRINFEKFDAERLIDTSLSDVNGISKGAPLLPDISKIQSVLGSIGDGTDAHAMVKYLANAVESLASVHPIANAAVVALLIPYKILRNEREFVNELRELANDMRNSLASLMDAQLKAKIESGRDSAKELFRTLLEASKYVWEYSHKHRFERVAKAQFADELQEYRKRLRICRENFRESILVQVLIDIGLLRSADTVDYEAFMKNRLAPVSHPGSEHSCMSGTRQGIFETIYDWLENYDEPNILFISGAPGAGKSAVASSIIEGLTKRSCDPDDGGSGCAKFFITRKNEGLRDPRSIWRTIAFELAVLYRGVKAEILDLLATNKSYLDPQCVDVTDQFSGLIKGPLEKLPFKTLAVMPTIVIDALDECGSDTQRQKNDWKQLLETLDEWSTLPRYCKLIVSSRRHSDILRIFDSDRKVRHILLDSGPNVRPESVDDVRHFFEERFSEIRLGYYDPSWPGDQTINTLTNYAAGLFVWARMVTEFVGRKNGAPIHRLQLLMEDLHSPMHSQSEARDTDVNMLYKKILSETFAGLSPQERDQTNLVLASFVWLKDSLPRKELEKLLIPFRDQDQENSALSLARASLVQSAIENLMPVITSHGPHERVQVCHKSFSDFLEDGAHLPIDLPFTLDRSQHSAQFTKLCLRLMNGMLHFNICNIPTSYFPNDLCPALDLGVSLSDHIPASLAYACRHWIDHLLDIDNVGAVYEDICVFLGPFLNNHLLEWMEVLSVTKSVQDVWSKLLKVASILDLEAHDKNLALLAKDAGEFMATFEPVIAMSVPHLYISALAFAPIDSKLSKIFRPQFNNLLSPLSGMMITWRPSAIIDTCDLVSYISFFENHDGQFFLSSSRDGFVTIFQERGPTKSVKNPVIARLPENLRNVGSMAVAASESLLAISSAHGQGEEKLAIFEIRTNGRGLRPLCEAIIPKTTCLLFAPVALKEPNGSSAQASRLASAHQNGSVRIWGVKGGQIKDLFGPLVKHRNNSVVNAMAFSPDGKRLVTGSSDRTLIRWNTQTGKMVNKPMSGHWGAVLSVSWSPSGYYIASGSTDSTIRTWYSEGDLLMTIPMTFGVPTHIHTIAFCPDAVTIISSTSDRTVRFWNVETGKQIGKDVPCSYPVSAVAFSPNREHMAALQTVAESPVQFWTAHSSDKTFIEKGSFNKSRNESFSSFCFSLGGGCIITGSTGGYVRVWDKRYGNCHAVCRASGDAISSVDVTQGGWIVVVSDGRITRVHLESGLLSPGPLKKEFERHVEEVQNRHYLEERCRQAFYGKLQHGQIPNPSLFPLAVSPDGSTIAFSLRESNEVSAIRLWTIGESFDPPRELDDTLKCIAFSPDGKSIVTGSEIALQLWRVQGKSRTPYRVGLPLRAYGCKEKILSICFSPDGRSLATISANNSIRVWDFIMKDGVPQAFNKGRDWASADTVVPVSFEGPNRVVAESTPDRMQFSFMDGKQRPAVGDWSYIDNDGWVRNTDDSEGYDHLQFWLPPANRSGFWWPRNSTVIARNVMRLDFSRFMRGGDWENCRTDGTENDDDRDFLC